MKEKTTVVPGDWYTDENNDTCTVLAVVGKWCMVEVEGKRKPEAVPADFVLATFNG